MGQNAGMIPCAPLIKSTEFSNAYCSIDLGDKSLRAFQRYCALYSCTPTHYQYLGYACPWWLRICQSGVCGLCLFDFATGSNVWPWGAGRWLSKRVDLYDSRHSIFRVRLVKLSSIPPAAARILLLRTALLTVLFRVVQTPGTPYLYTYRTAILSASP
jgi:hypothetical protein